MSDEGASLRDLADRAAAIARCPVPPLPQRDPGPQRPAPQPAPVPLPDSTWKVGLVLAGGAAKGGYQVGALEALATVGLRVHAVAGTSIGALNGAVVASAPSLGAAAERLVEMWTQFTTAVGRAPLGSSHRDEDDVLDEATGAQAINLGPRLIGMVRHGALLESMVERAIGPAGMGSALPFFVAGFRVLTPVHDPREQLVQYCVDALRRMAGRRSDIIHVNPMPAQEARFAVLASAALPLLFKARKIGNHHFRDGMLGGDNVPVRALVAQGCRIVVVLHLDQRPRVRVDEHPDVVLLEIRPRRPLSPQGPLGGASGALDFSPERFADLRAHGRADATLVLESLRHLLSTVHQRRATQSEMVDAVELLDEPVE